MARGSKSKSKLESFGVADLDRNPVGELVQDSTPYYYTRKGAAYCGDAADLLKKIRSESVNLILTSPPYALIRKKEYGNVDQEKYVEWFVQYVKDLRRVLAEDGSLVIDIGGSWKNGVPVRSTYHFELLLKLTESFHLAQEFYWYNSATIPSPAEWVNVRRIRVKSAVDCVWWLSKNEHPKADNRKVLKKYSKAMKNLLENGVKSTTRPSGHEISQNFLKAHKGAIPSNLIEAANTDSNSRYLRECRKAGMDPRPARFPWKLPDFFIRFLTDPGDLALDPFAGSNVTGKVAEDRGRILRRKRWH